ncbi:hypothetical protein O181_088562, partial [Austropuccinia psidii MF-1]|nr:hypothetical protein [Austropuccinia psidii MF-1]
SSIRESSSDSEASESRIEIKTSPAPRGLVTKETFKGPAVEVTSPSNQMDLDQDIQVINLKDKNVSPEERHKWGMPELPPVPKGNNRDIPVSVQELVYGSNTARVGTCPKSLDRHHELISSSEEIHRARKDRGTSERLDTHVFPRKNPTDKSLVKKPKHVIRGPEEEVGPRQGKQPSGSSQSLQKQKYTSTSAQNAQANPKDQPEWKGKAQMEQALPAELQDSQEREDSHAQCVQYGKNSDGIQKQGRGKIEPIFSKEVDLLKLVNKIETCNKEIITKVKTFEYIQQKLGNEILQVKESQKTMIGLENINKDNILSLMQICARIESKITLLNQPDDNSVSFIARQLKELKYKFKNWKTQLGTMQLFSKNN